MVNKELLNLKELQVRPLPTQTEQNGESGQSFTFGVEMQ